MHRLASVQIEAQARDAAFEAGARQSLAEAVALALAAAAAP